MIAALYVQADGAYAGLPGIDLWPADRDARTYVGPHPVVAHPPCQAWGRFAKLALTDEGGCFAAALAAVRAWGGVLEHPAYSLAWQAHKLPYPPLTGWQQDIHGGWCCYVEQGHYGHPARKPTWLYAHGVEPPPLRWGKAPQRFPAGILERYGYVQARRWGVIQVMGGKYKAEIRSATPPAFRDLLLRIAASAQSPQASCLPREKIQEKQILDKVLTLSEPAARGDTRE